MLNFQLDIISDNRYLIRKFEVSELIMFIDIDLRAIGYYILEFDSDISSGIPPNLTPRSDL